MRNIFTRDQLRSIVAVMLSIFAAGITVAVLDVNGKLLINDTGIHVNYEYLTFSDAIQAEGAASVYGAEDPREGNYVIEYDKSDSVEAWFIWSPPEEIMDTGFIIPSMYLFLPSGTDTGVVSFELYNYLFPNTAIRKDTVSITYEEGEYDDYMKFTMDTVFWAYGNYPYGVGIRRLYSIDSLNSSVSLKYMTFTYPVKSIGTVSN